MAQARAVGGLDLWSSLRWRHHLRAQVEAGGSELVVRTAEATVRVPAAAEPALRRLVAGETLTVAELGADDGLDDVARLELAGLLLRHAVVVPA
jgi:hypothetical protein